MQVRKVMSNFSQALKDLNKEKAIANIKSDAKLMPTSGYFTLGLSVVSIVISSKLNKRFSQSHSWRDSFSVKENVDFVKENKGLIALLFASVTLQQITLRISERKFEEMVSLDTYDFMAQYGHLLDDNAWENVDYDAVEDLVNNYGAEVLDDEETYWEHDEYAPNLCCCDDCLMAEHKARNDVLREICDRDGIGNIEAYEKYDIDAMVAARLGFDQHTDEAMDLVNDRQWNI